MMTPLRIAPSSTRVERNTDPAINERIRARTDQEVARLEASDLSEVALRLDQLNREWDIERTLQANASALVLLGIALGVSVDRRFLILPATVLAFFAQHALQGWCPPVPLLRRLGMRTAREIERERYAIKALRGDFDRLPLATADRDRRVRAVLAAIDN
jgi:hypothetical protein